MRGDYLIRWNSLFGEDGFHRLEKEGTWFQNCHYPYSLTFTAPGHASLVTGCSPDRHGVINNNWYDRSAGRDIYCVNTERYQIVPHYEGKQKADVGDWPGAWPGRLLAETLGDALKKATDDHGRVVTLSWKDRSAILMGCAQHPTDACYWFFPSSGEFVTSTYYRPNGQLHSWVAELNATHPADRWFRGSWERLCPDLDYVKYSGPDDVAGEDSGWAQGRTFPHPLNGGLDEPGESFYEAIGNSPYSNELLLELAKRAIDREQLGRGDAPDLLCLSFSANDVVGHCYGPDSQEALDITLRSDRIIQDLLTYLDAKVGRDRYVLAVTADHGICPLPQIMSARGKDAGRVPWDDWMKAANDWLNDKLLPGKERERLIEAHFPYWVYLNQKALKAHELKPAAAEDALASWFAQQAGVLKTYTRTQLQTGPIKDDPIGEMVRRSFHPGRSGDVAVVLKPYYLVGNALDSGTNHGSPHPYDTHVPLLVAGPGIPSGVREDPATPQVIAAILARSLGIPAPAGCKTPPPEGWPRETGNTNHTNNTNPGR
jgi:hypothetical protein